MLKMYQMPGKKYDFLALQEIFPIWPNFIVTAINPQYTALK